MSVRESDTVKGTVSQDFLLQVFYMNHLPQSFENNNRVISNLFADIRKSSCTTGINDTGGKFATGVGVGTI